MAKRIVSNDAKAEKALEKRIEGLVEKANKMQAEGKIAEVVAIWKEVDTLTNRKSVATTGELTPAETCLVDCIKKVKAFHQSRGEEYTGVVPNWSHDALKGASPNRILEHYFKLNGEERIVLTDNLINKGVIGKVRFGYTTKRGQRKGAHRLYLAEDTPESIGGSPTDLSGISLDEILNS